MTDRESQLNRLFEAARPAATAESAEPMPGYLKARVLAEWRSTLTRNGVGLPLIAMFRRALACAGIVMLASIAWSLATQEPDNDETVANLEMRADLMP